MSPTDFPDEADFMVRLISSRSDVVHPDPAFRRNESITCQVFDVIEKALVDVRLLLYTDVHQNLAARKYGSGMRSRARACSRLLIQGFHILGKAVDGVARRCGRHYNAAHKKRWTSACRAHSDEGLRGPRYGA